MKRILLLSTTLMLALGAFAQTFSVETETQNAFGYADDFDIYEVVRITNEIGSEITLSWEHSETNIPEEWDVSTCDPCQCWPIGVTSYSGCAFTNPGPKEPAKYVNTHFYPNGVAGTGYVKMRVWDEVSGNEVTVTFNATAQEPLVSVAENTTSSYIRSYPNPFTDKLNLEFNYTNTKEITLEVVDLLGKTVLVKTGLNSQENLTLDEELNAGIYFCVIKSEGKILDRIKVKKI